MKGIKGVAWAWSFVIALTMLQLEGAASAETPRGVMKGAIHFNIGADWLSPSYSFSNLPNYLPLFLFHDALMKSMPGVPYSPCLAESWTISPNYRIYEFKLRKGARFHNGDEVTAEDAVFTFKAYKGAGAKILQDRIERLEAVNPYLFRVTFKEPFPDFLDQLLPGTAAMAWIIPKKYFEQVGEAGYKRHPVGCGPYKFVEFVPGVRLVAEAFEGYWRKVPKVKRLEFYSVGEVSTRYTMVKNGEVDFALSMVDVYYERVKKDPVLKLQVGISPNHWILYIASQWDPKSPWSDPKVRKAASLAIDRKTLGNVNFPEGGPIGTIGLVGDPNGVPFLPDPYDPEGAKKLLAEAGYLKGFHGGTFYPYGGFAAGMGEMMVTYWKAVGIGLDSVVLDPPAWMANRLGGKMKGAIFNDPISAPTISGRLNLLLGAQSYGNYPDIQALWDQYNRSADPKERKELLARIQRSIHDRAMFIPLIKASTPSAVGPRVKGDLFKIREPFPIYLPCPMEDFELNE